MEGIQLQRSPVKRRRLDLSLCIICCCEKRGKKTHGTVNGLLQLRSASEKLNDGVFKDVTEENMGSVVYHMDCYRPYILKASRIKESCPDSKRTADIDDSDIGGPSSKITRYDVPSTSRKCCIICNNMTYKGDSKLHRICEEDRAKSFLAARTHFQDHVFVRTSTIYDHKSVFAADIMYHKDCLGTYLLRYNRVIKDPVHTKKKNNDTEAAFQKLIESLEFPKKGYPLTELTSFMNSQYPDGVGTITNKQLKELLINHYGETITFSYPKEKGLSQIVFSSKTDLPAVIDKVRSTNVIKSSAEILRHECRNYDFDLEDKFCDEHDLKNSLDMFTSNRPKAWEQFFTYLIPASVSSLEVKRQCDVIFQIIYNMLQDGRKKTPLHVSNAQTIHEVCRSKMLITSFNHLGLCISYDSLQRQDHALASRTVALAEGHRVPIPPVIQKGIPLRASMDNFDHQEDTLSGISGTHDTVLVLFQDSTGIPEELSSNSIDSYHFNKRKKTFDDILDCQKLVPCQKAKTRGELPFDFPSTLVFDPSESEKLSARLDIAWFLTRFCCTQYLPDYGFPDITNVPSWSSCNSLTTSRVLPITKIAYTPILPHPATQFSSIYTTMVNFQDALSQVGQDTGSLWCDEGVYRLARETQLLFPQVFRNIFIGLGSFHTCKVLISCIGLYLEDSGVKEILVENEIFGPKVVESVLNGGHYSRAVRGMNLFAEAIQRLQWLQFIKNRNLKQYTDLFELLKQLQICYQTKDEAKAKGILLTLGTDMTSLKEEFDAFVLDGCKSPQFKYWNIFLAELIPVMRDFIRADREGNWDLHLSAFGRALPLFFSFGRVNYARWGSVYYEDCVSLPAKMPSVHKNLQEGGFVVQHGTRKFSSIGMDQALEQLYNKPAKDQGGIIGITRRKQAVAQRDLIKHEKSGITQFHRNMCGVQEDDEYTLHHEFSPAITKADESSISTIVNYILERGNPFDAKEHKLCNLITGKHLDQELKLNCLEFGKQEYLAFKNDRFINKTKTLFTPLSRHRKSRAQSNVRQVVVDIQKDTLEALRLIDVARENGYSIDKLLTFELTSTSHFLMKDGFLRKCQKADLVNELEKELKEESLKIPPSTSLTTTTVFDFMLHARAVASAAKAMKTFGDLADSIIRRIISMSKTSARVDIVFDVYRDGSIKSAERIRRATTEPIETTIHSANSLLPKDMKAFWASSNNKHRLQEFFVQYFVVTGSGIGNITFYFGGFGKCGEKTVSFSQGQQSDVPNLISALEEADERIILHVHHAILHSHVKRVVVASSDTDTFVLAMYHYFNTFKAEGIEEFWVLCGMGTTSRAVPIHKFDGVLDYHVIQSLPAVHALTGCDTASKVGTKLSALKQVKRSSQQLLTFGKFEIDENMITAAENFLTEMMSTSKYNSVNDLRINQYHTMKRLDFEKLAPTSSTLNLHIKRAFLQCYRWLHVLDNVSDLNPLNYGYIETVDDFILPQNITQRLPTDFPHPCKCKKCARRNVCPCRLHNNSCSRFCECQGSDQCQNPVNKA